MAAQNKLFQRLIWLVDTIYSAKRITMQEINRRWASSTYNESREKEYGRRNFHRHRDTILELFGIDIVCDRSTNEFYLANLGDMENGGVRAWLIDTFAVNNMVNLAGDLQDRIIFEHIPEGSRYLSTIVSAMKEERQLRMTYQGFYRAEPHTFLVAPYCLKVFERRWYLVGKPDDHPEEPDPRVYALDRVHDIQPTDVPYHLPSDFDAKEFFKGCFGIDRSIARPEHIVIRTGAPTANFIRTLPLHSSQFEEERTPEYSIFSFDVAPTYDFIQELRKHGPYLEVLEPSEIRELFHQNSRETVDLYEKNA